ncbi:hypothetical protein HQQ80_10140 [Microbacteriaceae bacterium VKM Ac-2855]|nr:hypothetical protein [Microbacteriaceae bacterium VKM Ac-2855]
MRHSRLATATVVVATAAGLLSGCASVADTLPRGVSVAIQQNRDDYGPRRMELRITNDTAAPFEVFEARLDSEAFEAPAITEEPVEVPAGTTKALRVQLDTTACDVATPTTTVRVAYTASGRSGVATVEPADPFDSIARISAQDCLADTVAKTLTVTPADALRVVDIGGVATARLDITFTPTGGAGSVAVASVGGTVLLRPASGATTWPVGRSFAAGSESVVLTLDVVPNNCNTHTVSEDKRGTFFPLTVTTDAGTTGVFYIPVSTQVRGEFYDFIARDSCGWE